MRRSKCGVYTITCAATLLVYVGSTRHIPQRKASHFHQLRKGIHHSKRLQADFTAHGEAAFEFRAFYFPPDHIRREEQKGIAFYRETGLSYNRANVVSVEARRATSKRAAPRRRRRGIAPELLQKWREEDATQRAKENLFAQLRMRRWRSPA